MSKKCILVVYTDGSSDNAKGAYDWVGGFGVHGYLAILDEPTKKGYGIGVNATAKGYKDSKVELPVEEKLTVHKFFNYHHPLLWATNNYAELSAALWVFSAIAKQQWAEVLPDVEIVGLHLIADSKYVLEGTTKHMNNWKRNGWLLPSGQPPANLELWKEVYQAVEAINIPITYEYQKAHTGLTGSIGNDTADYLATCARIKAVGIHKKQPAAVLDIPVFTDKFSLFDTPAIPDVINDYNRLYFNSGIKDLQKVDDRHMYHLGRIDSADEDLTGMRKADISLAIVMHKEPIGIIDNFIQYFNTLLRYDDIRICRLYIDVLRSKCMDYVLNNKLLHTGLRSLKPDAAIAFGSQRPSIAFDPHDRAVARDIFPSNLSTNIYKQYDKIKDVYDLATGRETVHSDIEILMVESILPAFYTQEENKKRKFYAIRKELVVGTKEVSIDLVIEKTPVKVSVNLGYDCYTRNALARIADDVIDIKIIVYREYACEIRFLTLIETNAGEALVSSVFTNRLFI